MSLSRCFFFRFLSENPNNEPCLSYSNLREHENSIKKNCLLK